MRTFKLPLAFAALAALAACGDTLGDQAILGASAGTAGAVITNGNPVRGAVIGASANVLFCQAFPESC